MQAALFLHAQHTVTVLGPRAVPGQGFLGSVLQRASNCCAHWPAAQALHLSLTQALQSVTCDM